MKNMLGLLKMLTRTNQSKFASFLKKKKDRIFRLISIRVFMYTQRFRAKRNGNLIAGTLNGLD